MFSNKTIRVKDYDKSFISETVIIDGAVNSS